jgi:two-component system NtrC family sensor kinase
MHADDPGRRDGEALSVPRHELDQLRALLLEQIEERERSEQAHRASEERHRALADSLEEVVFETDAGGRWTFLNRPWTQLMGLAVAESLGRLAAQAIVPEAGDADGLWGPLLRGEASERVELVRALRPDGETRSARLVARPRRDPSGRLTGLSGTITDLTTQRQRDELLRRSERMASLGRALAGVAHELNNPLAAVSGFAQLLLRAPIGEEERGALEVIHREANRAARIVRDLLVLSRPGGGDGRHERTDLNAIVRHIVETRRYVVETRGFACELALDPALPALRADAGQIEQVILNLILNAEQALEAAADTPGAARPAALSVRTVARDGCVVLEVADTGLGIAPHDLPHIWDPFWTTKGEGTGLGLAITHGIVESHGGTITVSSEPERGTRFVVTLPPCPPGIAEAEPGGAEDVSSGASRALDILLVDDDASVLGFLERYLTSRGHAVLTARDGPAALRLAEHAHFDVVVCDLRLPGMDGAEIIRRLRALPGAGSARIILSTADVTSAAARERIASAGVAEVLAKPTEIEELRRAVEGQPSGGGRQRKREPAADG